MSNTKQSLLKHKSGQFPSGYIAVEIRGESVVGTMPSGQEIVTGWSADDATYFESKGLWVKA